MSIIRDQGKTKLMYFPKTASTALTAGTFVTLSSGQLVAATTTTAKILGVIRRGSAANDTYGDYTSATMVPVEVPIQKYVTWLADFATTTLTAAYVGATADLAAAGTVNVGATSYVPVTVAQFISSTKGLIWINATYA